MINMGKAMLLARQCLYIGLFLNIPIVASQTTVNGYVGQEVKIPCGVGGSYTWPQWRKGVTPLTSQDVAGVNPAYSRFSYDTDNKTLVISSAQEEDSGTYECAHTAGTTPLQNTIVVITEAIIGILVTCYGVSVAVCVFFVVTRVTDTVVIIKCIHISITEQNEQNEQNEQSKGTEEDTKDKIPIVRVILITAIVMFLAVSGWFIGMQATVDAFQEMTQYNCNVYIGLLSFEVFDFVLDVCLTTYLFYTFRAHPCCPP